MILIQFIIVKKHNVTEYFEYLNRQIKDPIVPISPLSIKWFEWTPRLEDKKTNEKMIKRLRRKIINGIDVYKKLEKNVIKEYEDHFNERL